jgi:hypothetical protein
VESLLAPYSINGNDLFDYLIANSFITEFEEDDNKNRKTNANDGEKYLFNSDLIHQLLYGGQIWTPPIENSSVFGMIVIFIVLLLLLLLLLLSLSLSRSFVFVIIIWSNMDSSY